MARDFSKVSPAVWSSKKFRGLPTDEARLAYLFMLTSTHQTSAGVCRLPAAYACADLGWNEPDFIAARDKVQKAELIEFDPETEEIWIVNWFAHNKPMNPSHRLGVVRYLERVESRLLFEMATVDLEKHYPEPDGRPEQDEQPRSTPGKGTNGATRGTNGLTQFPSETNEAFKIRCECHA